MKYVHICVCSKEMIKDEVQGEREEEIRWDGSVHRHTEELEMRLHSGMPCLLALI